ncbi:NADAR family protein, partial [Neisseria macacae]
LKLIHYKNEIDKAVFSQWYPAPFEIDGIRYATAEHYMMAEKARLFGADDIRRQIIASAHPKQAKDLGKQVIGFKNDIWNARRFDIVCEGNRAKFIQHPDLKRFLLGTGSRILVEASPVDAIWGIGLAQDDPRAQNPLQWRGLNLLGFALMKVRDELQVV